ncbi:Insulinase (Peptidase M16) [Rhizophlyctis rosea]|uniref:Insulinase (Peptidase M16) n=1 Tax=Rhizophlyctis rosea TaxID=64517 RepID=A0AAD5X4L9_9FUNG|nr:Insulinase (Peptidase M16) [Rhizophlyctis rosea]
MHHYAPEDILSGPYLVTEFGKDKIVESLGYLTPDKFRLTLLNPDFNVEGWQKAQWYGTDYTVQDFSEELVKAPSKPAIVQETPLVRMWHKKDDTFWVPKANVYFALKSPLSYLSPLTCVETRLYTDLLKDALNEYSYYAEVAGLSYALENNTEGFVLVCDGYNDKLSILLQKIVDKMVNLKINPERFKVIQEQEALKLAEIVENAFNPRPLAIAHRWDTMRTHLISRGASYVYAREVPNPKNLNSAIEYYVQVGDFSDADLRVRLSLFSQLGNEPCFDQLRTKEQLGYMVFSGLRKQTGLIGYRVIVQSEKDAAFVESRIEAFLEKMRASISAIAGYDNTVIKEMTPQEFEKHQLALSSKLLEKDKNLAQESSRLWSHVSSRYYYFDQHMHDADLVKQLSKEDVLSFYEEHLAVGASKRRKLSVHVRSQSVGSGSTDVGNAILQGATLLQGEDAIAEVKLSWPLGKGAVPVAPIESYFKP